MIRAKKSLGQNFLTSKKIAEEIVEAGSVSKKDTVIEIGPGKGILTEFLLERAGKVIALEKDKRMISLLEEKYRNLDLKETDALEFEDYPENYKLIANIPYYITGEILRKFLSAKIQPQTMVLMIQKEVGERIVARDGKESVLSMSVKSYGEPKIVKKVPRRYFSPSPKVDSVVLKIDNISKDFFKEITEEKFFEVLKKGFRHKRKALGNNLKDFNLEKCRIDPKTRAERLNLENWKCLSLLDPS